MNFQQSPNYSSRLGVKPTHIIIHAMSGSYQGSIATFMKGNGGNRVSAHYLISKKGEIIQMVRDEDKAWAVCNANPFTISIEHEDAFYTKLPGGKVQLTHTCKDDPNWTTPAMLQASAKLAASLIIKFNIPQDKIRERVIGHNNPLMRKYGNNHADPEKYWPWDKYYQLIEGELNARTSNQKPEADHS